MRIAVVGAGPAGLLFSLLVKRQRPQDEIVVVEQNTRDATFGFGVVFSRGALEFLSRDEPAMHATLAAATESWPLQRIVHEGEHVDIDGNGFSAIARIALLEILRRQCEALGVRVEFERTLESLVPLAGFDLVVGADGVNSMVRRELGREFQTRVEWLTNKFVWYGTAQPFECLTLTFRTSEHGAFVAHHYRYAPAMSTFIVECDAATWYRAGLDRASDAESRGYCERLFAPDLHGHPLISNKSVWRNFPLVWNARWSVGSTVLIGDALRTGHFSIGSGTRLAFDDAIFLARAFEAAGEDVRGALETFERTRRPIVEKLVAAANQSSYWYERMSDKMSLEPWQIAYDYMRRSGRMTDERLREEAPRFMHMVDAKRAVHRRPLEPVADPVPRDAPGAAEIGFTIAERYNASAILFDNLAAGRADKTAIVCGERSVPYGELCDAAARAGNGLRRMGLARGGRVLMLLDDTPEYAAAIFGAIRAGFVPVLVNTLSPAELVGYFLQDSGAEAAIVDARFTALLGHESARASRLRQVVVVGDGMTDSVPLVTVERWASWLASQPARLDCADTGRDEMAFWMYSSGSTGRPKGVVHLQHDPAYTYQSYGRSVLGIREHDVVFSPPKIFFAYGFGNSLTFPFSVGATTVLLSGDPIPKRCSLRSSAGARPCSSGCRRFTTRSSHIPDRTSATSRAFASASRRPSRSRAELFHEWRRRATASPSSRELGSTEALHIYLSNRPERQTLGASGMRVPGYELRLTDVEGHPVAKGESGNPMGARRLAGALLLEPPRQDGGDHARGLDLHGDRFRENEEGFDSFEGRADDLVKASGQWVYPVEVERCLAEHPAIPSARCSPSRMRTGSRR